MGLLSIHACENLDRLALQEQINIRREVLKLLVGWLYPQVLEQEIETLKIMLEHKQARNRSTPK